MWTGPPTAFRMICIIFLLYSKLTWAQPEGEHQPLLLMTVQLGETVTLQCFFDKEKTTLIMFYKQTVGHMPQLILSAANSYGGGINLHNEFENNPRITAQSSNGIMNITISKTQPSDSAIYYCGKMYGGTVKFIKGTSVILKGSESHSRTVVLQQPESESVQPGDSMTLQCTVPTETCAGEHSVYWFRHGSGESPPGIIYTHRNRSDKCQRSSGAVSPTQSCVYSFPKRNLSLSDAGTYYCAVATCGEVLFGNGPKQDVEGRYTKSGKEDLPVYCMVGVLTLSVILNIVLALNRRKSSENHQGAASKNQVPRENFREQSQDEALNYTALTFTSQKPKVRRNKREVEREKVYSDMRVKDPQ